MSIYSNLIGLDSIRLLAIHPGKNDDKILTKLDITNLQNAPPYEALSYVWGNPNPPIEICCNGTNFPVTPNLADALRRIRDKEKDRVLWIDALCIDQNNLEERSQQVAIMQRIYEGASGVLVWLGNDDTGTTATAFELMARAGMCFLMETRGNTSPMLLRTENPSPEKNEGLGFPPIHSREWDSVGEFFQRPWFERIWIVQEVTVGASAMMMVGCGDLEIDWLTVGLAATWFTWKSYNRMVPGIGGNRAQIIWVQRPRPGEEPRGLLLGMLGTFSSFKATEPRDKIYALLNLTREGLELETRPALRPDYRKPVVDVYCDVVRDLIQNPNMDPKYTNQKLGILNQVFHFPDVAPAGFPSWVPRWDLSRLYWTFSGRVQGDNFFASKELDARLKPDSDPRSLILQGLTVDTLVTVDRNVEEAPANELAKWEAIKFLWTRRVMNMARIADPRGRATTVAFARAITAGTGPVAYALQLFDDADFAAYCLENLKAEQTNGENAFPMPKGDYSPSPERARFFAGYIIPRPFFTTRNGMVGLGNPTIEAGDRLCILFGGVAPFILRPKTGYFEFVGECYVPDLMNGEAIDWMEAGHLKEEWFELR